MKLDIIQCNVVINHGEGNVGMSEIPLAGVSAITVPEALILMTKHSIGDGPEGCALKRVIKVGEVEIDQFTLLGRLRETYGRNIVDTAFPTIRHIPKTVADLDLPKECMGPPLREIPEEAPAEPVTEEVTAEVTEEDEYPKEAAKDSTEAALKKALEKAVKKKEDA